MTQGHEENYEQGFSYGEYLGVVPRLEAVVATASKEVSRKLDKEVS